MLRADNVICGTSSTGAGTLTLAACPSPPGGVDPFAWLTGSGLNFVNTNALFISYTIIEYTSSAFTTAKSFEKGVGLCTLGSNVSGTTLARTKVQQTGTGLDTSTPTMASNGPSAITIGTAANVLVFVGASANEMLAFDPWLPTTDSFDALGIPPLGLALGAGPNGNSLTSGDEQFVPFIWATPMLVKRASFQVHVAYSGGTPISNAWAALYDFSGTQGRPGKKLYDFGLLGTSNASLNATGYISSGAGGSGFWMAPGEYVMNIAYIFSGGSVAPQLRGYLAARAGTSQYVQTGKFGTRSNGNGVFCPMPSAVANSAASGTRSDPANTTNFNTTGLSGYFYPGFALKDS